MRRHCEQQHPDLRVSDERTAQWDWGLDQIVILGEGEGEGAFWKRKSQWTQLERKQKRKKMRTALRNALHSDMQDGGRGGGGASVRCPGARLGRKTFPMPRPGGIRTFPKVLPAQGLCRRLGQLSLCQVLVVGTHVQLAMSSSPINVASLVPSSPSFLDKDRGLGGSARGVAVWGPTPIATVGL